MTEVSPVDIDVPRDLMLRRLNAVLRGWGDFRYGGSKVTFHCLNAYS